MEKEKNIFRMYTSFWLNALNQSSPITLKERKIPIVINLVVFIISLFNSVVYKDEIGLIASGFIENANTFLTNYFYFIFAIACIVPTKNLIKRSHNIDTEENPVLLKSFPISPLLILIIIIFISTPIIQHNISNRYYSVPPASNYTSSIDLSKKDYNYHRITNTYNNIVQKDEYKNVSTNTLSRYEVLDENEKAIYDAFVYAIKNFDVAVLKIDSKYCCEYDLNTYDITEAYYDDLTTIFQEVINDNPQLYWAVFFDTDVIRTSLEGNFLVINISYTFSSNECGYEEEELNTFKEQKKIFDNNLKKAETEIIKSCTDDSEWQLAYQTFTWLSDNTKYDNDLADDMTNNSYKSNGSDADSFTIDTDDLPTAPNYDEYLDEFSDEYSDEIEFYKYKQQILNGGIYSLFVNNTCVCRGYSEAFQLIMNDFGINCCRIFGNDSNDIGHVWNIINFNDEKTNDFYNVDVTSGDTGYECIPYDFKYFCVDDTTYYGNLDMEIKDDELFNYPSCDSMECSYYVRNDLYFEKMDSAKLKQGMKFALKNKLPCAQFLFKSKKLLNKAYSSYYKNGLTIQNYLIDLDKIYDSQINFGYYESSKYLAIANEDDLTLCVFFNYEDVNDEIG